MKSVRVIPWWEVLTGLMLVSGILCFYGASQIFWLHRVEELLRRLGPQRGWRGVLGGGLLALYFLLLFANTFLLRRLGETSDLALPRLFMTVPFALWNVGSVLGFLLVGLLRLLAGVIRAVRWIRCYAQGVPRPEPLSPARRAFLERSAYLAGTAPFLAAAYGYFHGRLDLETSHVSITLPRLPQEFHGFRAAQLSDIHIGTFMPAEQIRKIVALTNSLKPDLVVLTGDFVTWDNDTQYDVVAALAGLRAPYGILGCLGNHEIYTEVEDSITHLFAQRRIRILRSENYLVRTRQAVLNIIGVDYQRESRGYLVGTDRLLHPGTANILLSHNPNSFPRAAELGIDLTLSGHTHGGQIAIEILHRNISPSRFITEFVRGHFRRRGGQLYVNRGLGTIGFPIRLNAPPEVTLLELVRG